MGIHKLYLISSSSHHYRSSPYYDDFGFREMWARLLWKKKNIKHCGSADSLVGGACNRPAWALDGVHATIQPLHTSIHGTKFAHTDAAQLQKLTLVTWQHAGWHCWPLKANRWETMWENTDLPKLPAGLWSPLNLLHKRQGWTMAFENHTFEGRKKLSSSEEFWVSVNLLK